MIVGVYSMRDEVAQTFTSLTTEANDQTAVRNFAHALSQPNTILSFRPADFALYRVGSFDTDTGAIAPESRIIMRGVSNADD